MRVKVFYCFWVLLLLVTSCKNARDNKPALSQVQMVPVIYDLILTEEFAAQHSVKDSTIKLEDFRSQKYVQVFGLHKVDVKTFTTSYDYYMGHPDEMKAIYDSVQTMATRRRLELMRPSERTRDKFNLPKKGKLVDSL